MNDVLCYSIDTESEAGAPIAERYGVGGLPTLVVLEPNGDVRDRWSGYLPPEPFIAEIQRIARNEGTIGALRKGVEQSPDDLEKRFAFAAKLKEMDDSAGYLEQVAAIAKLDPSGTHIVSRRLALARLTDQVMTSGDPKADDLLAFLAEESDADLQFQGHELVTRICSYRLQTATGEEAVAQRKRLIESYRIAWLHHPAEYTAAFGNGMAWSLWLQREHLDGETKGFALEVAKAAVAEAKDDPMTLDTLACCLYMNGHVDEAIAQIERCIELSPDEAEFKTRLELFRAGN